MTKRKTSRKPVAAATSDDDDSDIGPMPAAPAVVEDDDGADDIGPPPPGSHEDEQQEEGSDSEEIGPALPPAQTSATTTAAKSRPPRKKRRALPNQSLFLDQLPCAEMYERSFMHRDQVLFTAVTRKTDFIITSSADGHIKFWKKTETGMEFVKHFRSHLASIQAMVVSDDGLLLATVSTDKSIKVYDVVNFDMINMISLEYTPRAACWVYKQGQAQALLAVSDQHSANVYLYDGKAEGQAAQLEMLSTLHTKPVTVMAYHPLVDCVVSADESGMIEYWSPSDPAHQVPTGSNGNRHQHHHDHHVQWEYKSDTDLYDFVKAKSYPTALVFSPDYRLFATFGISDRQVRIFKFGTGKLVRKYDESLKTVAEMQQAGTAVYRLDSMEFGRRLAVERELEKSPLAHTVNLVFDESGQFILYPTLLGIKVVSLHTNNVVSLIGKGETTRFLNISMYQGSPKKKVATTLAMAASDNPTLQKLEGIDPTLVCTSFKKNRFYLFTKREPDSGESTAGSRDVFNEKPSREEQLAAQPVKKLGTTAIIRTTFGDIFVKLFPEYAPKTVENFTTHAKSGYYNNHIFHRVIRGFMIQTGDPTGTGAGGTSIWDKDFDDEFNANAKHDKPYTLSMANCGPNTNGSQFFVTVAPTPWLNNKHTVFGRATAGMDVVHKIENVRCVEEKPLEDIRIINIEVRQD